VVLNVVRALISSNAVSSQLPFGRHSGAWPRLDLYIHFSCGQVPDVNDYTDAWIPVWHLTVSTIGWHHPVGGNLGSRRDRTQDKGHAHKQRRHSIAGVSSPFERNREL
jgi:hypothetical protein